MIKEGNVDIKDGVFTFNQAKLTLRGPCIDALPDENFKIELKFKTKSKQQHGCGIFRIDSEGHGLSFRL